MDTHQVQAALADLPLGGVRFFSTTGSTNDEASGWALAGAPDLALVVAGEQTAGRGRNGRLWLSPPGSSLSFSLVIHPRDLPPRHLPRFTALGALSVASCLQKYYALPARIKWPNDVLVGMRKVCGVLVEASWQADYLQSLILGIGINVAPHEPMTAALARSALPFPASSLQDCLGQPVEHVEVLRLVVLELLSWLPQLPAPTFLQAWEEYLAFKNEWVQVMSGQPTAQPSSSIQTGKLLGLASDGSLRLRTAAGEVVHIHAGEIYLRPLDKLKVSQF